MSKINFNSDEQIVYVFLLVSEVFIRWCIVALSLDATLKSCGMPTAKHIVSHPRLEALKTNQNLVFFQFTRCDVVPSFLIFKCFTFLIKIFMRNFLCEDYCLPSFPGRNTNRKYVRCISSTFWKCSFSFCFFLALTIISMLNFVDDE